MQALELCDLDFTNEDEMNQFVSKQIFNPPVSHSQQKQHHDENINPEKKSVHEVNKPIIHVDTEQDKRISLSQLQNNAPPGKDGGTKVEIAGTSARSAHDGKDIEKPYKCETCSKSFACPSRLNRHMVSHATGRSYQCEECDRWFKTRETQMKHMKIKHAEIYDKIMLEKKKKKMENEVKVVLTKETRFAKKTCPICQYVCRSLKDLQAHVRKHGKKFKCENCEKMYTSEATLCAHQRKYHVGPESSTPESE